jgi:hypothetical protein
VGSASVAKQISLQGLAAFVWQRAFQQRFDPAYLLVVMVRLSLGIEQMDRRGGVRKTWHV